MITLRSLYSFRMELQAPVLCYDGTTGVLFTEHPSFFLFCIAKVREQETDRDGLIPMMFNAPEMLITPFSSPPTVKCHKTVKINLYKVNTGRDEQMEERNKNWI